MMAVITPKKISDWRVRCWLISVKKSIHRVGKSSEVHRPTAQNIPRWQKAEKGQ